MVRTLPSQAHRRLDFQRILATSFAIALHVLALLVLLLPLTRPSLPDLRPQPAERWRVHQVPPTPPLPPQLVQPPKAVPAPAQPATPVRIAPVAPPALVDHGSLPAEAVETVVDAGPVTSDITPAYSGPLQGAELRHAVAPPPTYPRDAMRSGAEGTVLLRVLVDVDGRPLEVSVERGSGHRSLDRQALRQVQQHWRFEPAMREGRPVQAWGLVPISFSLQ